jgi:hypothetical protein
VTDRRFERELTDLLRDIAGAEAPLSLRSRVETLLEQAPIVQRPWFRSPIRLSLAGLSLVAVVAVAFLVGQSRLVVGPPPSASPGQGSPSPATPNITPMPKSSPVEPSPSVQPSSPTPQSTQVAEAGWSGLHWSDPVLGPVADNIAFVMNDVHPWGTGFVGAGMRYQKEYPAPSGNDTGLAAVFLTSPDGRHWTISQQDPGVPDAQCAPERETPHHLLAAPDGSLIAFSDSCAPGNASPKLWRSTDGVSWSAIESSSWQAIWSPSGGANTLFKLAAGPEGIVAIGGRGSSCCGILGSPEVGLALIAFSADGVTWQRLKLSSAFDDAWLRDVVAYGGGFAVVGRVGEVDGAVATNSDATPTIYKGVGTPAAWVSADGRTWQRAAVEGSRAAGATLTRVAAGAGGLFALGWQKSDSTWFASGVTNGWASTDGHSWSLVGNLGSELPSDGTLAGDGSHIVLMGHAAGDDTALMAWSSSEGVNWTRLAFSGSTSLPRLGTANAVQVVPGGLVVGGFRSDVADEQFWFATATGP